MLQYNSQTSMNLAFLGKETNFIKDQRPQSVQKLEQKLQMSVKVLNQTHSTEICELTNSQTDTTLISADAILTRLSDVVIGVQTADCVPLLFYTKNYIGAIHLGRKSLNDGLLSKVLGFLIDKGENLEQSYFYLGPSLGFVNHSTWAESATLIPDRYKKIMPKGVHFLNNIFIIDKYLKDNNLELTSLQSQTSILLDSPAFIKDTLTSFGVPIINIFDCQIDTFADSNYHSYRRESPNHGINFSYIYKQ